MLIILTNCVNRQTNTEGGTFLLNYFFGYDPNSINVSGEISAYVARRRIWHQMQVEYLGVGMSTYG